MDWLFHIVPARPRWRPRRKNAPWDAGGRSWRSENDSGRRSHLRHILAPGEPAAKGSKRLADVHFRIWKSVLAALALRPKRQPTPANRIRIKRFAPAKTPFDCPAQIEPWPASGKRKETTIGKSMGH